MYNIVIKGYFEVEDCDKFVESIQRVASECNAELIGNIATYQLAPYVDYQRCDDSETQN